MTESSAGQPGRGPCASGPCSTRRCSRPSPCRGRGRTGSASRSAPPGGRLRPRPRHPARVRLVGGDPGLHRLDGRVDLSHHLSRELRRRRSGRPAVPGRLGEKGRGDVALPPFQAHPFTRSDVRRTSMSARLDSPLSSASSSASRRLRASASSRRRSSAATAASAAAMASSETWSPLRGFFPTDRLTLPARALGSAPRVAGRAQLRLRKGPSAAETVRVAVADPKGALPRPVRTSRSASMTGRAPRGGWPPRWALGAARPAPGRPGTRR